MKPSSTACDRNVHAARIVGVSPWALEMRRLVTRVAPFDSNVLISGPTGTGKGLISQVIHDLSSRAARPFISFNCATLSDGLAASQLFGHERGAFTGATEPILGCFRAAQGGTLFLDEIGELDVALQAKMLSTLETRRVTPLGSDRSVPVDVRIIAATNRDLAEEIGQGRFRRDLYYRLRIVSLRTQPLREHPVDIPALAEHALAALARTRGLPHKRLAFAAIEFLQSVAWPGNVRQLQNLLEQAVILADDDWLEPSLLRSLYEFQCETEDLDLAESLEAPDFCSRSSFPSLSEVERRHIAAALSQAGNNKAAAARLLGLTRQSLLRRITKLGLSDV